MLVATGATEVAEVVAVVVVAAQGKTEVVVWGLLPPWGGVALMQLLLVQERPREQEPEQ